MLHNIGLWLVCPWNYNGLTENAGQEVSGKMTAGYRIKTAGNIGPEILSPATFPDISCYAFHDVHFQRDDSDQHTPFFVFDFSLSLRS